MRTWLKKTLDYIDNHEYGGHMLFGNHGISIDETSNNEKLYRFSYFGSDIVIINLKKRTITVDNFGYTKGSTPCAISEILNHYDNEDYEVIKIGDTESDYWYNRNRKYFIGLYDIDIKEYHRQAALRGTGYYLTESPNPIVSTVVTVPDDMSNKQFRDMYFQNIVDKTKNVVFLNKYAGGMGHHYGIAYRFSDSHFGNIRTLIFAPAKNQLTRRTYITIR